MYFDCNIHPTVILSILDAHERRVENADRVIGAIIGNESSNSVEITDIFVIPLEEGGRTMNIESTSIITKKLEKSNSNFNVLGWFSSLPFNTSYDIHIHQYFSKINRKTLMLVVDTKLVDPHINILAYVGSNINLTEKICSTVFNQLNVNIMSSPQEKLLLNHLIEYNKNKRFKYSLTSENGRKMEKVCKYMHQSLMRLNHYIEQVLQDDEFTNPVISPLLLDLTNSLPILEVKDIINLITLDTKKNPLCTWMSFDFKDLSKEKFRFSPTNLLGDYNVFPLKQESGNNIVGHFYTFSIIKWVLSLKHEKSTLQFRRANKEIDSKIKELFKKVFSVTPHTEKGRLFIDKLDDLFECAKIDQSRALDA
ncbi:hypothetical protein A3Q56_07021 [Intoshia linei]|uniref:MPN domain-containing protein n=1 Tax=Intoshia linei TaxID=1819745 RepID=A0A177ATD9_9BILA|nr:hypothetical protein A3Q56_07021 [Intoshia linei]